jgi:hypothetical protein
MLIPLVCCIFAYIIWRKHFLWWELTLPTSIVWLFILVTKLSVEQSLLTDIEYRGGLIVEARYYEYWDTWVNKTCSRTYACGTYTTGTGSNKTTHTRYCTEYYDCSYCSRNDPNWVAYDNQGHSWNITKEEYNRLKKQWNSTPEFVELNRNINYKYGCGNDGDMYKIKWDGNILSSESSTWTTTYENHVQVSKSHFDLRDVSEEEAKKFKLYEYPKISNYKQKNILGLDSMNFISTNYKLGAYKQFEYLNGLYGPKRKMRIYVLLFNDKPYDIAIKQKNYWKGGNKNEIIICIDVDKNTGKINWVYPFSWGENKRITVDLREDIMNLKYLNFTSLYHIIDKSTENFKYRDFSQFNYLSVDIPNWIIIIIYIITTLITFGMLYYGYINEFKN